MGVGIHDLRAITDGQSPLWYRGTHVDRSTGMLLPRGLARRWNGVKGGRTGTRCGEIHPRPTRGASGEQEFLGHVGRPSKSLNPLCKRSHPCVPSG